MTDAEMIDEQVQKCMAQDKAFFERHGFPNYLNSDADAFLGYLRVCNQEGVAYVSPMARRMFTLGWLIAKRRFNG